MTDTMGGKRGGVGIRLFVQGGEVVRRTFDQVGDSGRKMWAEIALGQKSANPAIRALSAGVGELKQGIGDLASRAGSAANVLGAFGAAGVAAAVALGILAMGLVQAREAMSFAADLTDVSDRIGIGVEALQQWRYVADESGVSVEALQANMEKLNGVLGAFKLGVGDAKLKPIFEELGISKADLDNIQTADQLMMMLADTLGQVQDRAMQVRLARGLGVEDSLPILRLGSERVRELLGSASDLGVVLDQETNAALDAAERKLELANQKIKILTYEGVEPLATAFADTVSVIADLVRQFENLEAKGPSVLGWLMAIAKVLPLTGVVARIAEWGIGAAVGDRLSGSRSVVGNADATSDEPDFMRAQAAEVAARSSGFDLRGHTAPGSRSGANSAARERERLQREQERLRDQLAQREVEARRDVTRARWSDDTPEARAQLAKSLLAIEQEQRAVQMAKLEAELIAKGALDEAASLQLKQLADLYAETDALADRRIINEYSLETAKRQLQQDQIVAEDAIALMQVHQDLAVNARDRYAIGRRILIAQQELERKVAEAAANEDGAVTPEEQKHLDSLAERQSLTVTLFDQQEQDRLREQFKDMGRTVVQAIEDGDLGDYIGDQLKARMIDMALDGLFNLSQGAGGGGSPFGLIGSVIGGLFGQGPGRAGGGGTEAGFRYNTVEHGRPELLMIGGKGHVTSAAETVRLLQSLIPSSGPSRGGTGAGEVLRVEVDKSDLFDVAVRRVAVPAAEQAGAAAFARSVDVSRRGASSAVQDAHAYRD